MLLGLINKSLPMLAPVLHSGFTPCLAQPCISCTVESPQFLLLTTMSHALELLPMLLPQHRFHSSSGWSAYSTFKKHFKSSFLKEDFSGLTTPGEATCCFLAQSEISGLSYLLHYMIWPAYLSDFWLDYKMLKSMLIFFFVSSNPSQP